MKSRAPIAKRLLSFSLSAVLALSSLAGATPALADAVNSNESLVVTSDEAHALDSQASTKNVVKVEKVDVDGTIYKAGETAIAVEGGAKI